VRKNYFRQTEGGAGAVDEKKQEFYKQIFVAKTDEVIKPKEKKLKEGDIQNEEKKEET
jgi:hypothetical protein